ncbi:formate dehydrogenase accessory sulfurtransferase FdhD [Xanthomonas sp. PPL139]|uniref:formate dehydrogenase accessory sulfurtransferase FdhD n=1 Tax=unclassified Xanthomonas TaxID=2643310 RepID=UPI0033AEE40E
MSSGASSRPGAVARGVRRHRDGRTAVALDLVAAEVPVAFAYNDTPFVVMMATPEDLEDFALGFSLSEGIVATPDQLRIEAVETYLEGVSLRLRIPPEQAAALQARRRNLDGRSGCGVCGSASLEAVLRTPRPVPAGVPIAAASLARALRALRAQQTLNALTGATHAAAWADAQGALQLIREDVGRHNALDKLIGALVGAGLDPGAGFAVVTSRASYEMVMKATQAGIPLLAAISAPTALAVALADSAGLTLIGFARDHDYVVYSHPQRLAQTEPAGEPA